MTTNALRTARAIADKAEAAPLEVYREIVRRWDKVQPGDAERLAGSLTALGITDADVDADLREMEAVRTLSGRVRDALNDADSMPTATALEAQVERFDRVLAHEFDKMLDGKRQLDQEPHIHVVFVDGVIVIIDYPHVVSISGYSLCFCVGRCER